MGRIFTDDFNRVSGSLGSGWTERNGGAWPLATNMSTDGTDAILDANGFAVATADSTSRVDQFVQCWVQRPDVNNNCGICWRVQSNDDFYYAVISYSAPSQVITVYRAHLATGVTLLGQAVRAIGTGTWHRLAVEMIGSAIKVYWQDEYNTTLEGPILSLTDANFTNAGPSGIVTSGNDAVGLAGGIKWSDFVAYDGEPETIYVDVNGTAGVDALGTAASPDIGIGYGLNAPGLRRGGALRVTNDSSTPVGNGGPSTYYTIGHDQKFAVDGSEAWPEYDARTGAERITGRPNLTIEGADVATDALRTILRETQNRAYFTIRGNASWVLFRGFQFDQAAGAGASSRLVRTVSTNTMGASVEHSVAVDKCRLRVGEAAAGNRECVLIEYSADSVRLRYSYCDVANQYADNWLQLGLAGAVIKDVLAEYNVFHGTALRAIYADRGPPAGSLWRFNHNHYIDHNRAVSTVSCVEFADGSLIIGDVELENNLMASRGANPVAYGTRITANSGAVVGTIHAHHNGYYGIGTPRGPGVLDTGDELDSSDPEFLDEAVTYTWPQTAQSPALVLASDWRPGASPYLASADDTYYGVPLDRGALQVITLPPPPPGPRVLTRRDPDICVRVIYDPSGTPLDLSERLLIMRPIRQEKDILQRSYKLSDTHLEVTDPDGRFLEDAPLSVLKDANGNVQWYGKEVLTQLWTRAGQMILEYRGFVIGITNTRGKVRLRLANRFQQLFERKFIANDGGRIVSTDGTAGTVASPPASGSYPADVTPFSNPGCPVETWTFTFLNTTQFTVVGSETGEDGTGEIGSDFTSNSGRIRVLAADWTGAFVTDDQCSIKTVYRYTAISAARAFYETLTNSLAANLDPADVDASVLNTFNSPVDQPLPNGLVEDDGVTILEQLEHLARHMLGVAIEKADGKVGLYAYFPRLEGNIADVLCKHSDLMQGVIDHTPIYNVFQFRYGYSETDEEYVSGLTFPKSDPENPSLNRFQRETPAPVIDLKGFTSANADWVRSMAQQSYTRWSEPRPIFEARLKASRLGMEIDDLFRVDSHEPTVELYVEPATLTRDVTSSYVVEGTFLDASFYLQFERDCGFAFMNVGHLHDNCWLYF